MQGPVSLHQMRAASLSLERALSRSMPTDRNIPSDYHTYYIHSTISTPYNANYILQKIIVRDIFKDKMLFYLPCTARCIIHEHV